MAALMEHGAPDCTCSFDLHRGAFHLGRLCGLGQVAFDLYTSVAAPFALLVPVFGGLSAFLILGETLSPLRLVGSLMIFAGLAFFLLPWQRLLAGRIARAP